MKLSDDVPRTSAVPRKLREDRDRLPFDERQQSCRVFTGRTAQQRSRALVVSIDPRRNTRVQVRARIGKTNELIGDALRAAYRGEARPVAPIIFREVLRGRKEIAAIERIQGSR